ncbi:MAG: NAD-dependent deacetylase [Magnetococcales bacterium]|nr:NAD-dependent deacetylase [Magnetococcales bacterium]
MESRVDSLSAPHPEAVARAREAVRAAGALLVTAGAGMGVDSGLPDFRGQTGFWQAYPAIAKLGISFPRMANPSWFQRDPRLAWAFYGHRLKLYRATQPHAGFVALQEIAASKPQGGFVLTSNVDGHFQKAGWQESLIVECHGSIHHLQCTRPCSGEIWSAAGTRVSVDPEAFRATPPLPVCPRCGAIARPNILMFSDDAWIDGREVEQQQRLSQWLATVRASRARLAIIEIGAGHAVPTIRMSSEHYANLLDGVLIRINPRDFTVPHPGHVALPMGGAAGIGAIRQGLN